MKRDTMILLLDQAKTDVIDGWPDEEGGSLIRTLAKAWGDGVPSDGGIIYYLLFLLIPRAGLRIPGARDSSALVVAHLLPKWIRCG